MIIFQKKLPRFRMLFQFHLHLAGVQYDSYWGISHGCLLIKVTVNSNTFMLPPFGGVSEDLPKVLDALKEYFGGPFEIHGVYEHTLERFQSTCQR